MQNEAYQKLSEGERIVDFYANAGEKSTPAGRAYLVDRDTERPTLTQGARDNSQRWKVVVLKVFSMSDKCWNNTIGLKAGKVLDLWINVEDLPDSLHDDSQQIEMWATGEYDSEAGKQHDAAIDAGVEHADNPTPAKVKTNQPAEAGREPVEINAA